MTILYYSVILVFLLYAAYIVYKGEKEREMQLHLHLTLAKKILNNADIKDSRNWFIDKFSEAESHLINAQASCAKDFEFSSVIDIRTKLNKLKNGYKN